MGGQAPAALLSKHIALFLSLAAQVRGHHLYGTREISISMFAPLQSWNSTQVEARAAYLIANHGLQHPRIHLPEINHLARNYLRGERS